MFLSLFIFGKSYAQAPVIEEITPNRAYVSDEVVIKVVEERLKQEDLKLEVIGYVERRYTAFNKGPW